MNKQDNCLSCKKKKAKTRGLCPACYQASRRAIREGETTEAELKEMGLLLDRDAAGRKPRNEFLKRIREKRGN